MAGARWFETQEAWAAVQKTLPAVMHAFMPDPANSSERLEQVVSDMLAKRSIDATNERIINGDFQKES